MAAHEDILLLGPGADGLGHPEPSHVGLKAAGLAELVSLGLPVPPAAVLGVGLGTQVLAQGALPDSIRQRLPDVLKALQERCGRTLGDPVRPLLLSVRSSTTLSMPGLMDSILNVGATRTWVQACADGSTEQRVALDVYRRLIVGLSSVAFGMRPRGRGDGDPLRDAVERACDDEAVEQAGALSAGRAWKLVDELLQIVERAGHRFPEDPLQQLELAITAVVRSANNERVLAHLASHGLATPGVACIIQCMALGNHDGAGGTGVAISRHPRTGERVIFGEFLRGAQGEDLLGGYRSPAPLRGGRPGAATLEREAPDALAQLEDVLRRLETHLQDVPEVEFTVEQGTLWLLQVRPARRSARAAVKIAMDMLQEGLLDERRALLRVEAPGLGQLLAPQVASHATKDILARGVPASVGVAVGQVVFHAEDAQLHKGRGQDTVLVRMETRADDLPGMEAATGVVTARGGTTSHAAVMCRALGKCCVVGCPDIRVDYAQRQITTREGRVVREGDVITVDGQTGEIMLGRTALDVQPAVPELSALLERADKARRLHVRASVDAPGDLALVDHYGAQGVHLRTEPIWLSRTRRTLLQQALLTDEPTRRETALSALEHQATSELRAALGAVRGRVAFRLLDIPRATILPRPDELSSLAGTLGLPEDAVRGRAERLRESHPGFGTRGIRLAWSVPGLLAMQARAVLRAVAEHAALEPLILLPMITTAEEVATARREINAAAAQLSFTRGVRVGAEVALAGAVLHGAAMAAHVDEILLDLDGLTQSALGLVRADAAPLVRLMRARGLLTVDPFTALDADGVGGLVHQLAKSVRRARPDVQLGAVGGQVVDRDSAAFLHAAELDFICAPLPQIAGARLAAAQAALLSSPAPPET